LGSNLLQRLARDLGVRNTIAVVRQRVLRGKPLDGLYAISAGGVKSPVLFRLHSTDSGVFNAIFRRNEYGGLKPTGAVDMVIDCGANVGYSSLYFLTRYPNCRVIAVEPDPENFAVLARNLAPYRSRVQMIRSGVWSHPTGLRMSESSFRDGREWSRQVRECAEGEAPELVATDIGSLLVQSGASRISILKIDVERAETEIFARNYEQWLDRTDNIVIELHDDECRSIFGRAITNVPFRLQESGELTICSRESSSFK
jgi:FkbM family methyltransferase